jgi:hypothetical protein
MAIKVYADRHDIFPRGKPRHKEKVKKYEVDLTPDLL